MKARTNFPNAMGWGQVGDSMVMASVKNRSLMFENASLFEFFRICNIYVRNRYHSLDKNLTV